MSWAPPAPGELPWFADNFADHIDHDVNNWAKVNEINRVEIERTTERFADEPEYTIFVVKNIESSTTDDGFYCNTCHRELDLPDHPVWNT